MTDTNTIEELIQRYGQPIYRFKPTGIDWTTNHKRHCAQEYCVFKLVPAGEYCGDVITYSRYGKEDAWYANSGDRYVIRELLLQRDSRQKKAFEKKVNQFINKSAAPFQTWIKIQKKENNLAELHASINDRMYIYKGVNCNTNELLNFYIDDIKTQIKNQP